MALDIAAWRWCPSPKDETVLDRTSDGAIVARSREMTLSLPPFTRAVTWLLAINTAVFLLLELFGMTLIDVAR